MAFNDEFLVSGVKQNINVHETTSQLTVKLSRYARADFLIGQAELKSIASDRPLIRSTDLLTASC